MRCDGGAHTGRMSPSTTPPHHRAALQLARIFTAGALVAGIALVATDDPAEAAGFAVTTTADGGAGSLRDAIDQANANPGPDTITVPAGTYTITIAGATEDDNATGDFDVVGELTINGAGAGTTIIDADGLDRAFDLHTGPVVLAGMTITNGDVGADAGGNIQVRWYVDLTLQDSIVSHGQALQGAGIVGAEGELTVIRSEVTDNVATSIFGNGSLGSAISKSGDGKSNLIITDSLIADNNAVGGTAAVAISGNASITNTTITGNSAYTRTVLVEGHGAYSMSVSLVHVTIAGNTETGTAAGVGLDVNVIAPASMAVTLEGSLLQDNLAQGMPANCAVANLGTIVSAGNNLADDASCFLTQPSDNAADTGTTLAALADNGGPTRTLALVAGSSAIDAAGNCGAATPTDQRGVARPSGAACDAGAYEMEAIVEEPTTSSTSTTSTPIIDTSTTETPTTQAPTTTNDLDSGGGTTTTLPFIAPTIPRGLPATGGPTSGLWLALLVTCLGGLLLLAARRLAR